MQDSRETAGLGVPPDGNGQVSDFSIPTSRAEMFDLISGLQPGSLITNLNGLVDVDLLFINMGNYLRYLDRGEFQPDGMPFNFYPSGRKPSMRVATSSSTKNYRGWRLDNKPPSAALRPKNFFGNFVGTQALLLSDMDDVVRTGGDPQILDVLLATEMQSTRGGAVGTIRKLCTIAKRSSENATITVKYEDVGGVDPNEVADEIVELSGRVSRAVAVEGMMHAYQGGLPGLGKRH